MAKWTSRSGRAWFVLAAWAAVGVGSELGCAESRGLGGPSEQSDSGSPNASHDPDGGPREDSGLGAETPDAAPAAEEAPFEFELRVVNRRGAAVEGARVRIDAADGTLIEGATDADGRFALSLDPGSAPCDVTVARESYFTATTILGVTGPIDEPISLAGPLPEERFPTRTVSGTVTGFRDAGVSVELVGPTVEQSLFSAADGLYSATIAAVRETSPLRVMALEWGPVVPTNAAWVELDRRRVDLSGSDIVLPSPPRPRTSAEMTIELPHRPMFDGSSYLLESGIAYLTTSDFEYPVGAVTLVPEGGSTFQCLVEAFEGDMAPTDVRFKFVGSDEVIVEAAVESGSVINVPAAEELSANGTSLEDLRVTLQARDYAHVGASFRFDAPWPGTWFVYSYRRAEVQDMPWPRLPTGLQLGALNVGAPFSAPPVGKLNLFALTRDDGHRPWNWNRGHRQRALIMNRPLASAGR